MEASYNAATNVLVVKGKPSLRQTRNIREWANCYCLHGTLPDFKQGCHIKKSYTIILNRDVQYQFREMIREYRATERSPNRFMTDLNGGILNSIPGAPATISIRTAQRWMYFLGFHPSRRGKSKILYLLLFLRIIIINFRG